MTQIMGSDDLVDKEAVLKVLGECRRHLLTTIFRAQINGPIARATSELIAKIDDMAELLTGNRGYFYTRIGPWTLQ